MQIFTNSLNGSNFAKEILVVYDVKTDATGLVNRHLGNTVNGHKVNPGIPDERMNLKGYNVRIYPTPVIINNSYLEEYNRSPSDQLQWEKA